MKKTNSNIELKTFYGNSNTSKPGEYPYKHGIYPNMYTDRLWTMRQYSGFSSTKESNRSCLLYTSPSPRDRTRSRMPSSA